MRRSLIALAFIAMLAVCNILLPALTIRSSPTPAPFPVTARSVTPSPYVFADCIQAVDIYSWQDVDRDGLPDPDEPPLPGVPVELRGWFGGKWTTDERGRIYPYAIRDCPLPDLVVIAESPPGYTPTTPLRVTVEGMARAEPVRFGFAKDAP
jgi:hypothetical protein